MPDLVQRGIAQRLPQDRLQPIGPFQDSGRLVDQIVAHLKQRVRKPAPGPVPMHGVVSERAGIGLVVPDPEAMLGAQPVKQRL